MLGMLRLEAGCTAVSDPNVVVGHRDEPELDSERLDQMGSHRDL